MEKENQDYPKQEPNNPTQRKKGELILSGEVVSIRADKTISVMVERIFQHPVYRKIVRKKKRYMVHDEHRRCKPGDSVRIKQVRPISKRKCWLLTEVISTAPVKEQAVETHDANEVTP